MVVGATGEASNATGVNGNQSDNSATDSGAAYVFVRSGTNWTQQAYLKASNTGADDYFGWSVAVSGDTVVVGALGEDSNATGVNGNQSDNSALTPARPTSSCAAGRTGPSRPISKPPIPGRMTNSATARGGVGRHGGGRARIGGGQQRHWGERRPERQQRIQLRRGLRLRAQRNRLDPAGLSQSLQHRSG